MRQPPSCYQAQLGSSRTCPAPGVTATVPTGLSMFIMAATPMIRSLMRIARRRPANQSKDTAACTHP